MTGLCEKVSGSPADAVRICGGEARSEIWTQLRADITGKVYELPEVIDCSALGAAVTGAVCLKIHKDYTDAISHMVRIEKRFYPCQERQRKYEEKYQSYMKRAL